MKNVFYHFKDNKNATHIYKTNDELKQIKSDLSGNGAVLDAIYNDNTKLVTLYSKNLTIEDVIYNVE